MRIIDKALKIIAPNDCVGCGDEGLIVCESCRLEFITSPPSRCPHCLKLTISYSLCNIARKEFQVAHMWVASEYDGVAKSLVRALKFGGKREAAAAMAKSIQEALPYMDQKVLIVPCPTITRHNRLRGFDHAWLIASELANILNLELEPALYRIDQKTQVGAKAEDRRRQLRGKMYVAHPEHIAGRDILLVDDVFTTGSTLSEAAKTLRQAGATHVNAAIFSQKVR